MSDAARFVDFLGEKASGVTRDALAGLAAIYEAANRRVAKVPGTSRLASLGRRGSEELHAWAAAPASRDVQKSRETFAKLFDFVVPQDELGALFAGIPPVRGIGKTTKAATELAEHAGDLGKVVQAPFAMKRAASEVTKRLGVTPQDVAAHQAVSRQVLRRFDIDPSTLASIAFPEGNPGTVGTLGNALRRLEQSAMSADKTMLSKRLDRLDRLYGDKIDTAEIRRRLEGLVAASSRPRRIK